VMSGKNTFSRKRTVALCALLILLVRPFLFLGAAEHTYTKARLAVIGFDSKNMDPGIVEVVTEFVQSRIENSQVYILIERYKVEKVLAEQAFQYRGVVDETTAIQIGKILGAEKLVLGSINRMGQNAFISGRIVDVETGEIEIAASETGSTDDIRPCVDKLVRALVNEERTGYQVFLRRWRFDNSIRVNAGLFMFSDSINLLVNN
ncbi:MAG: CsgG/HfaB family protein, partial [Endomicrobiales bacterium]